MLAAADQCGGDSFVPLCSYAWVSRVALAAHDCREINGEERLVSDPSVLCHTGSHSLVELVSWVCIVAWVAGIPLSGVYAVHLYKDRLTTAVVENALGFLVNGVSSPGGCLLASWLLM